METLFCKNRDEWRMWLEKKHASEKFLTHIVGESHMLNHTNLSTVMNAKKNLINAKNKEQKLEQTLQKIKKYNRELITKTENMQKKLDEKNNSFSKLLSNKKSTDCSLNKKNDVEITNNINFLKKENSQIKSKLNKYEKNLYTIEREKRKFQIKYFEACTINENLTSEINQLLNDIGGIRDCNAQCKKSCPNFDLCKKRILVVGGITKLKTFYKKIVESGGGAFEYHDGYIRNSKNNLEAIVKRSDFIICPVNCNSHGACSLVKKFSKKYNKNIKMLHNSSISAISEAIAEMNN